MIFIRKTDLNTLFLNRYFNATTNFGKRNTAAATLSLLAGAILYQKLKKK